MKKASALADALRAIDGARTRGLDLGKVARYQLRHYRTYVKRVMGIEPTYLAWKASVLPLNYTRICPEPESNQWHEDFQSSALPTELSGLMQIIIINIMILRYNK